MFIPVFIYISPMCFIQVFRVVTSHTVSMERQISIHRPVPTEVNISAFSPLLKGHMNNLPPVNSKIVRVFVSSTFSGELRNMHSFMLYLWD